MYRASLGHRGKSSRPSAALGVRLPLPRLARRAREVSPGGLNSTAPKGWTTPGPLGCPGDLEVRAVDLCPRFHAEIEEVSLTPTPQLPTEVLAVW